MSQLQLPTSGWFSPHNHSKFSVLDGLTNVGDMVAKAAQDQQPCFSLTDHGLLAGCVQAYQAGKKHGVKTFLGVEGYLIDPAYDGELDKASSSGPNKVGRFHFGLQARDLAGYQALVRFVSLTHTRPRFNRFPRATLADLATLGRESGDHLVLTTGCVFGLIQQTLLTQGGTEAARFTQLLASWFPHTFVEVQHHHITHESGVTDDQIVQAMIDIAHRLSLPLVAASDSHYCDSSQKQAHGLMKKMIYGSIEDAFPGDSFHVPSAEWVSEHYTPKQWNEILLGHIHLESLYDLVIPPLDTFKAHVPAMEKKPNTILAQMCDTVLQTYVIPGKEDIQVYYDRLDYELDVIRDTGTANFFLFMDFCLKYLRRKKVCFEARGSANGSLVCFLLRITQVDPIYWGTDFDRFMARDRIKPPDIDMDIEDESRHIILDLLASHFDTMQIGTFAEIGVSIDQNTGEEKGSVFQTYLSYMRRSLEEKMLAREEREAAIEGRKPVKYQAIEKAKSIFYATTQNVKSINDIESVNYNDYINLRKLAAIRPYKSYGVHAAGVLISGADMPIRDWIPSMLVASSNTTVTQYMMDDVEALGLLKGDWLGQTSLSVMRRCQDMIGRSDPTDFSWIPYDDRRAMALCREGRTDTGIFHVEGWTKSKGAKELRVRTTRDLILLQALYMPGAMESGAKDRFIARRNDPDLRTNIPYPHPIVKDALDDTLGELIFQEQVLNLSRAVGMDGTQLQDFFKVIKDSGKGAKERNRVRLKGAREMFISLASQNQGIDRQTAIDIFALMAAMGSYGFNKGHATGYGLRSYRTAYLKAHYPMEYMTALLQCWAGKVKEKPYATEARRNRILLLPPDVNVSGASWTLDRKAGVIRKGLQSIPGVGPIAAMEIAASAPYLSIDDLIARTNPRKITGGKVWTESGILTGILKKLEEAGALESVFAQPASTVLIDDVFAVTIPEPLDPTDIQQRYFIVAQLDDMVHTTVHDQWDDKTPPTVIFNKIEWLMTNTVDGVDDFVPVHNCTECWQGVRQVVGFLIENPDRWVALANVSYTEIWTKD